MKKTHIILLVLVVAAIATIAGTFINFSTYETFDSAAKEPGKSYHVMGYFDKGKGLNYDPKADPNKFTFFATDKAGIQHEVVFINGAPPRDIEKSEQLVMKGYMKEDKFICSGIQMKCPSKYKRDMTIGEGA